MLQRSTADLPCCDRCQWTSRDSAITYLRDISMVAWVFAIEWWAKCWVQGPLKLSQIHFFVDTRKIVNFCGISEKEISGYRFKMHISVYMWKEEDHPCGLPTAICLSCLFRYRPPISFTTLQLFIYLWNPKCLTLNPQSLFFGCKFVDLHVYFHFAWNVPHIPWSSLPDWLPLV